MLKDRYIPYSERRMNMIIDEAKYAQIQCDFLSQFKKHFKRLWAIIISIVVFVANKIIAAVTEPQILNINLDFNILFNHLFLRTYCKRFI